MNFNPRSYQESPKFYKINFCRASNYLITKKVYGYNKLSFNISMKKLVFITTLCLLYTSLTMAKNYVHEGYHVHDPDLKILSVINTHPDLTVDHLHGDSYEVYGPRGLNTFLKNLNVHFHPMQNDNLSLRAVSYTHLTLPTILLV